MHSNVNYYIDEKKKKKKKILILIFCFIDKWSPWELTKKQPITGKKNVEKRHFAISDFYFLFSCVLSHSKPSIKPVPLVATHG